MSDLSMLLDKAIKALPAKSPVRAEIAEALESRKDFSERGRKAWETRRAMLASQQPAKATSQKGVATKAPQVKAPKVKLVGKRDVPAATPVK